MSTITTDLNDIETKLNSLNMEISSNFDLLEKKLGNYTISRYLDRSEDLKYDHDQIKDRFRDLSRELEYLGNKLSDLDYDREELTRKIRNAL